MHTADPNVDTRCYEAEPAGHAHDFHQVVLGGEGGTELEVEGHLHRVDAGAGLLIPAGTRHDYRGLGENRQLVVDLPADSVALPAALFERTAGFVIDERLRTRVRPLLGVQGRRVSRPAHWMLAARFADDLAQRLQDGSPARDARPGDARRFPVARIDAWLRAHVGELPTLPALAARFGYGPRRFHDLFAEAFGCPPHRYLTRLRLDAALTLMAEGGHALSDVAAATGFADQSAFTRRFAQRFGVSPGRWPKAGALECVSR
ncbi:helix-turn-helix transcriptional regulator [Methyloversatilis thermotolerans]|uniref:helix-turn-helix transcriptional regulator n=1 Tax=Methyloversatilis thermotolerans TaxID=1346290 RepID=UPI00035F7F49|nr:AraC family transcriptional regulator [Methyloversatilis thermotolerans]